MSLHFRHRLMRTAVVVSTVAIGWAVAVLVSGGLVFDAGPVRVSSRRALNPALFAAVAAGVALVLATADERRRAWRTVAAYVRGERAFDDAPGAALAIAVAAGLSVATFGVAKGLFVAAAADAYGYVSQADLWARGEIVVRQPWARDMTWHGAAASLAPLGYRPIAPAAHGTDIVPTYSPGVPMLMAIFELAAGPRAVYYVVPMLGGLAVIATFVMGRRLAGPFAGASAAVLLATSPAFLFEVTAPASDVAATAWWAVALAALTFPSRRAAIGAGLAAGAAILTRPNVAPLAAVIAAPMIWSIVRGAPAIDDRRRAVQRLLSFSAGAMPACLFIGWLNWRLYGSPFLSGYGSLRDLYAWNYAWTNLTHYASWLVETATPIVILATAAPFLLARLGAPGRVTRPRATAVMWLGIMLAVLALYLFYLPFDDWWYLRFMLPAFPPMLVLTSAAVFRLAAPITRVGLLGGDVVATIVVSLLAWHGLALSIDRGAHKVWDAEQRYVAAGAYVRAALPERAALVAVQHSGSARFYSGRITVRYDALRETDLDLVVNELRRLGYQPYFLLDEMEEAAFRRRFAGHTALGALDWAPKAVLYRGLVRVYDPSERVN